MALVIGDFQPDGLGRVVQAPDVLLALEYLPAVGADALEDPVAVQQAVVEDRHLGLVLLVVLAVDPDLDAHGSAPSAPVLE